MNGSGDSGRGHDSNGTYGDSEGRAMPSGRAESDMGDRRQDNGGRDGRPAMSDALSGDPFSGARAFVGGLSLDALLAAAVRGRPESGSEGEARAVAAFRAAREQGVRTGRTRRRDDWRPNPRRRVQLSIRTTLAVLLSSLTLGGVAFAAIGSAARDDNGGGDGRGEQDRRGTSNSAPAAPGPSGDPGAGPSPGDRPATAEDTEAHCRAYEEKAEGRGKALDATAWQRLTDAAGGTANVAAYCAVQLSGVEGRERAEDSTEKPGRPDEAGGSDQSSGPDEANGSDRSSGSDESSGSAGAEKPDEVGEPTGPSASDKPDVPDEPSAASGADRAPKTK